MSLEDNAQQHELQEWEMRNAPRQVSTYQPGEPGYGPEECDLCGAEMHQVRRANGWRLCTACQTKREATARRR